MKKKLLTTLIGSLIAGPTFVFADTVNVNVYGKVDATFENVEAEGATATGTNDKPARFRVSSNSSTLGFKGSMDAGSGMKGIFQYETTVALDDGSGLFSSARDNYVGMSFANVGSLKLGRLSAAGRWINGIGDYSPGYTGINANQGITAHTGGTTGKDVSFNGRLANALGFESDKWGGFSVRAYYGANEAKSNEGVTPALDNKTFSVGLGWAQGMVDVRYALEIRDDIGTLNNTTANDSKDTMNRVGVIVNLQSKTSFGLLFDMKELEDSTATGAVLKKDQTVKSWQVGVKQEFGSDEVYAGYGQSADIECTLASGADCPSATTDNTSGRQIVLGYNHNFNKQLMFKAYVSKVTNKANARYDFDVNGISPAAGADPTGFGAGLIYKF